MQALNDLGAAIPLELIPIVLVGALVTYLFRRFGPVLTILGFGLLLTVCTGGMTAADWGDGPSAPGSMMSDGRPVRIDDMCFDGVCTEMRRDTVSYWLGYLTGDSIDAWNNDGWNMPSGNGDVAPAPQETPAEPTDRIVP